MGEGKEQSNSPELGRYKSAADIPFFVECAAQLKGLKLLRKLSGINQDDEIAKVERELNSMVETVDGFYDLLGDRNWIFHETLNYEKIKGLVGQKPTPEDAEASLIVMYNDEESLKILLYQTNHFEASRKRYGLIAKAKTDYFAGRYYSCVMLLLAVIDGFVNEFESTHRGFHARESTEYSDWGRVTAHHKGIERVHKKIYTKTISVTREYPVFDLYRNGIMHGTVIDFDNIVVATKAWNMLFSALDWAKAKQVGEKAESEPQPTLSELMTKFEEGNRRRAKHSEDIEKWNAYTLESGDDEFNSDQAAIACKQFLDYWQAGNYGNMAAFLSRLAGRKDKALPKRVREEYQPFELKSHRVVRVDNKAPVVTEITAVLDVNGCEGEVTMRWLFESDENDIALPISDEGEWRIVSWGTSCFLSKDQLRTAKK